MVTEESQEQARVGAVQGVVDAVRMRALPSTQNRLATLILRGEVFYRPVTATWYLGRAGDVRARGGDGRALRTMRATGLIRVCVEQDLDVREAYPVAMTDTGTERYRPR